MTDYIRTYTGCMFPVRPRAEKVSILDIAHGLALNCRWCGQSRWRYSVAAHSIYVSRLVPDQCKMEALLHDASEAYMADVPAPFKAMLPDYRKLESELQLAIASHFGLTYPWPREVHRADAAALYAERRALFAAFDPRDVPKAVRKLNWDFDFWCGLKESELQREFLLAFHRYENL